MGCVRRCAPHICFSETKYPCSTVFTGPLRDRFRPHFRSNFAVTAEFSTHFRARARYGARVFSRPISMVDVPRNLADRTLRGTPRMRSSLSESLHAWKGWDAREFETRGKVGTSSPVSEKPVFQDRSEVRTICCHIVREESPLRRRS